MKITAQVIKDLREKTGAPVIKCKEVLEKTKGDFKKALTILKKFSQEKAATKSQRETKEGLIEAYIHSNGKLGVLIEVNCETDFVARNSEFKELIHDLAMQVAACNPVYIKTEDIPSKILEEQQNFYREELKNEKKPKEVIDKIVKVKMEKFYDETCIMRQPFIKNPEITISDLISEKIAKLGENIEVRRFIRYRLGEKN